MTKCEDVNPFSDLPGKVTVRLHDIEQGFLQGYTAVVVEHDMGAHRVAGWVPVSKAMLEDMGSGDLMDFVDRGVDRHLRPWRYPDPPSIVSFELFPTLARLRSWVSGWRSERRVLA